MGKEAIDNLLSLSDLTDDTTGIHAINLAVKKLYGATAEYFSESTVSIHRGSSIVTIEQEFDNLLIPHDHKLRSKSYGFYFSDTKLLRTHPTSLLPNWLQAFSKSRARQACCLMPAICFVQAQITKNRIPTPHKLDIWHIKRQGQPYTKTDVIHFVQHLFTTIDKNMEITFGDCSHPYTSNGISANVNNHRSSMKILEGGLIGRQLLEKSNLDPALFSGFGIGLGVDRLVMLMENVDDIRLIRTLEQPIQEKKKLRPC